MDMKSLMPVDTDSLKTVSLAREMLLRLGYSKGVHEDIVNYMVKPLEDVLQQNGVNLNEDDL